jgi:hypothetical protein
MAASTGTVCFKYTSIRAHELRAMLKSPFVLYATFAIGFCSMHAAAQWCESSSFGSLSIAVKVKLKRSQSGAGVTAIHC